MGGSSGQPSRDDHRSSLGEGLETGFWRIADPGVHWVSVDLPEIIALREQLLPTEPQLPRGRGFWGWPAPLLGRLPVLRAHRPAISLITFACGTR